MPYRLEAKKLQKSGVTFLVAGMRGARRQELPRMVSSPDYFFNVGPSENPQAVGNLISRMIPSMCAGQ